MPSPFYTPGADIFGGAVQARREAQNDFASRLGQLYAGGNQQAGQTLGGLAPEKLDAIRSALEKMPATEQAKAKQRVDMLKKWIFTISQTQDEPTRALLWNQMIAQAHQSGADISNIQPNYSADALEVAKNGLMTLDELMSSAKESRLTQSMGGNGTEGERRDAELANGDPTSTEWQTKYLNRYMTPQKTGFNPISGAPEYQYLPAPAVVSQKALSVGLGLNEPSKQIYQSFQKQPPTVAPGEITAPGSIVNGTPVKPVVPTTTVTGPAPGMSRVEQERIAGEERERQRKLEEEKRKKSADAQQANAYYDDLIRQMDSFIGMVKKSNFGQRAGFSTSQDAGRLAAQQGILLGEFKGDKLFQLGVLNAGDKPFIQGIITDIGGSESGFSLDRAFLDRAIGKLEQAKTYIRSKQALQNRQAGMSGTSAPSAPAQPSRNRGAAALGLP